MKLRKYYISVICVNQCCVAKQNTTTYKISFRSHVKTRNVE